MPAKDRIAQIIRRVDGDQLKMTCGTSIGATALAEAIVSELGLHQEWVASDTKHLGPTAPPQETREQAQRYVDRATARFPGGSSSSLKPDGFVMSRYVTDWERDDG